MRHEAYRAAIAYLQSLIHGPGTASDHKLRDRTAAELLTLRQQRLVRMRGFLSSIGNPESAFQSIHVGGTSGKGSTAACIHAILLAFGLRSGLHTSPYLQVALEKLVVGDHYLAPAAFAELVAELRPALERTRREGPSGALSYGESWVALTFLCFARLHLDIGVVEVGLGGRWDYTNVLPSSVSVITSIGLDHTRSLGSTLPEIAYHKAGIVKRGTPAVVGPVDSASLEVIRAECDAQHAPLWLFDREFTVERSSNGTYTYRGPSWVVPGLEPALRGAHQVTNAALAVAAVEALRPTTSMDVGDAIRSGLASVQFPGRFEVVQRRPTVVLDGAHNVQKAEALASTLRDRALSRKLHLVFGALAAKQANDMLAILAPLAESVIVTAPRVYQKEAADPTVLQQLARPYCARTIVERIPARAIERALAEAAPEDVICVSGSIYLVGEIRERWVPSEDLLAAAEASLPPPMPQVE